MKPFLILAILAVVAGALLFGSRGCENVFPQDAHFEETEDENYLRGKELAASGRVLEAMEKFHRVVKMHPDASAESNLELGLLALKQDKCPTAIYHFERYLSLRPDADKRNLVLQQIDLAKKKFIRQMVPGRATDPASNGGISLELEEKYKAVMRENEALKLELETLHRRMAETPPATAPASAVPAEQKTASAAPQQPASAPAVPAEPPRPAVPATHTVVSGDTLSRISQKYYGTTARWREIYEMNRVTMSDPGALRPGMVLKLPRPQQ